MNYSSRFFLYAPFALLLAIAAVVGMQWWFAADALGKQLDAMNAREAMPGVTIRFAARSIGGFPFNLDAVFRDFRVTVATPHGPARWRAEHFALHALTYGRDETIFEAAGKQSLGWTDMKGRVHELPFETGSLHASAIESVGALSRFDLDIVGFGSPALTATRLQFHIRHVTNGNRLDVFASGDDIHLSPSLHGAFGDEVKLVALQGSIGAASTFDELRAGRADWHGAVEAWRNASGTLHADPFEIEGGGLDMVGHGDVSSDADHRPQGLLDFKITGLTDWLAHSAPSHPGGIAAALRDRAAKAGANEAGRMGAVLGARDGIVYLGDEPAGIVTPLY